MPRPLVPPWLRRGLEAAVVAAIVAVASLWGDLDAGGGAYPFPTGLTGGLLLAPAILAIGVLTTAYPIAMAATRTDAVMGAMAGFLIAADLTIIFAGTPISLERLSTVLPAGVVVALLAFGSVLAGVLASQIGSPLGFGRRAGAIAAVASAVGAVVALAIVSAVA